jgi:hypothetical protein
MKPRMQGTCFGTGAAAVGHVDREFLARGDALARRGRCGNEPGSADGAAVRPGKDVMPWAIDSNLRAGWPPFHLLAVGKPKMPSR